MSRSSTHTMGIMRWTLYNRLKEIYPDSLFQDKPRTYVIPIEYPVPVNNHNTSGELAEFIDCVVNDKPMLMTGEEGAKTVIAALAAVESTKTGMPVRPDYTF